MVYISGAFKAVCGKNAFLNSSVCQGFLIVLIFIIDKHKMIIYNITHIL